jgi:hypothetical protein
MGPRQWILPRITKTIRGEFEKPEDRKERISSFTEGLLAVNLLFIFIGYDWR